ncbi:MAG TPA: ribosomal protein S18-alanine N-acetyltransferase [Acidimicrobiales bacterium]|nr:ribosomal protein S18-alanine N-acetyltransferase [Acidimicrobiales bacterium]
MRNANLDEVIAIERSVFSAPWSRSLYREELAIVDSRRYLVALDHGSVIGYVGLMLIVDEAHVTTIAVDVAHQGRGIGKLLLYSILEEAISLGASSATLEVRVSNKHAQALYHQFGFVPAGIRRNYYAEVNEDGLVMWAHDLQGEESRLRLFAVKEALEARALLIRTADTTRGIR